MTGQVAVRPAADVAAAWDDLVDRSPQGTPFHRAGFLEVVAEESGAACHRLVGLADGEPVGLLPVFETAVGPVTAALSPPPDLKVTYLGPALLGPDGSGVGGASAPGTAEPGRDRGARERRHREFVDACLDAVDAAIDPGFVHVRAGPRYADPRPFEWAGFDATPGYTYVVDLDRGAEVLFDAFSGDARRNVRDARDAGLRVREGGVGAVERTVEQVAARHAEQGEAYGVTPGFVAALYDRLGPEVVRPYVAERDGRFVGGMVVLEAGDTVYRWQGGAKPDADVPVNDYLDWRVLRDAADRGLARYDLVGAGNPRLCGYKAKFDPGVRTYRGLRRASAAVDLASRVYDRLR